MEHFTRYFVRDAEGEAVDVYDGDDDFNESDACRTARECGYTIQALDFVSDGQYRNVPLDDGDGQKETK